MKTKRELIEAAEEALNEDDYYDLYDVVYETMSHISDLRGMDVEPWDFSEVKEVLFEIGELVYEAKGFEHLQLIYKDVYYDFGPIGARYLEHGFNGVGDGAWRS